MVNYKQGYKFYVWSLFRDFGSKVINIKPILKKLQSILENKDQSVRVEAKLLTVILYSWVGLAPVKANLTNLKPLQVNFFFSFKLINKYKYKIIKLDSRFTSRIWKINRYG